ncbi:MAG: hypothetical protein ABIR32_00970 [Ilumatobacteraceae bacterium]
MAGYSSRSLVLPFTRRLLAVDLPGLEASQRDEVAEFTSERVDDLPSVLRLGVTCIAAPMRIAVAMPGAGSMMAWLIRHPLPLVGEYIRMIRSLAYTYVWEHWPATLPNGAPTIESDHR